MKFTPERLTALKENEVFVFGSNLAGRHGRGAALLAVKCFGAKYGQGIGLMGQSYGIATKDKHLKVLPLEEIQKQVIEFLAFTESHHELTFLVTQIGCGLAGYKPKQIAPMFDSVPPNVLLPEIFASINLEKSCPPTIEH